MGLRTWLPLIVVGLAGGILLGLLYREWLLPLVFVGLAGGILLGLLIWERIEDRPTKGRMTHKWPTAHSTARDLESARQRVPSSVPRDGGSPMRSPHGVRHTEEPATTSASAVPFVTFGADGSTRQTPYPEDRDGGRRRKAVTGCPYTDSSAQSFCRCSTEVEVSANIPLEGFTWSSSKTETHVHQFLRYHSEGPLYVVVGYASVWGLAWLQEHTLGRPVTLIIGNTRRRYFKNATNPEREKALELIDRSDVEVFNWYRSPKNPRGESMLHAKAWVVADRASNRAEAALIGSANLTKDGMQDNWEMMAIAADTDLPRIWAQLDGFMQGKTENNKPWPDQKVKQWITEGLTNGSER